MNRIVFELLEEDLRQRNNLTDVHYPCRAKLIGGVVSGYLANNRAGNNNAFGLWANKNNDEIFFESQVRKEWEY